VTGEDLKRMGLSEGKRLGEVLRAVYDAQLNKQVHTRQAAMTMAELLVRESRA